MKILVLDTETTFYHNNHDTEDIVEIAICEIDTKTNSITKIYDEVIGYDLSDKYWEELDDIWIFNNSTLNKSDVDIRSNNKVKPIDLVVKEVREIIKHRTITSYNVAFDFGQFLRKTPWYIDNLKDPKFSDQKERLDFTLADCIMLSARDVCKMPGRFGYKYPKLDEAIHILKINPSNYNIDEHTQKALANPLSRHRAFYDCVYAAMVLIEIMKVNNYVRAR